MVYVLLVKTMNKIIIENLSLQYSDGTESLRGVSMGIREKAVSVLFGPAGGGKSTLLRCLNRLNDLTEVKASSGRILIDGEDILDPKTDVIALRRKVGMVFARPVVLPMSIQQNLTYGLELAGEKRKSRLDEAVERSLKLAAIWGEVKDRLDDPAIALSGGQQQRICLARVLALQPEIILLDEPTSGLDPLLRHEFFDIIRGLTASGTTVILASHVLTELEARTDLAAIMRQGRLVAFGDLDRLRLDARLPVTIHVRGDARAIAKKLDGRVIKTVRTNGQSIDIDCAADDKMSLLRLLAGFGEACADVEIRPPSLEDLYLYYSGASALAAGAGGRQR